MAEPTPSPNELAEQVSRQHTPNAIFMLDLETNRIVSANDRFEELLGYPRAELMRSGFDFFTMIHPDSEEKVRRSREMHGRGEEHLPFEYTMVTRDGSLVEVTLNSWLTNYNGHRAVVGIITDVTEQHRLADELRRAAASAERERARAESVIAAIGESIVVQDPAYRITF